MNASVVAQPGDKAMVNATPIKRAKWHLGIRSQSKPHDIMQEVYRAMKALGFVSLDLGFNFGVIDVFFFFFFVKEWKVINPYHVRVRRDHPDCGFTKMSLQLYQVDFKSYLLDFKSFSSDTEENESTVGAEPPANQVTGHHTMEFFEMCAALITQLAR